MPPARAPRQGSEVGTTRGCSPQFIHPVSWSWPILFLEASGSVLRARSISSLGQKDISIRLTDDLTYFHSSYLFLWLYPSAYCLKVKGNTSTSLSTWPAQSWNTLPWHFTSDIEELALSMRTYHSVDLSQAPIQLSPMVWLISWTHAGTTKRYLKLLTSWLPSLQNCTHKLPWQGTSAHN